MSWIAAVAISWTFMISEPSPARQTTVSSGQATLAPIAAGSPKPIVPRPPELIHVRGDDRVAAGGAVHRLHHQLRLDLRVLGVLVPEWIVLLPVADLLPPGLEAAGVRAERLVLLGQ